MTLSDERVVKRLNDEFVCTWSNSRPRRLPTRFDVIPAHRLRDWRWNFPQGTGAENLCVFLCSPDGWVLHEMRGFVAPPAFLEGLRFARDANQALAPGGRRISLEAAAGDLSTRHRTAIRLLAEQIAAENEHPATEADGFPLTPRLHDTTLDMRIQFHHLGASRPLRRVEDVLLELGRAPVTGG